MPPKSLRSDRPTELRRRIERLEGLPLRPETARTVLAPWLDTSESENAATACMDTSSPRASSRALEGDPGWVLALERGARNPLVVVEQHRWWCAPSRPSAAEAVKTLWRHAVATSGAARRLATECGGLEPERAARLGLLCDLPLWGLAAVDPDRLAEWLALPDGSQRREHERALFGADLASFGRDLAERWGADPLLADAVWLHADLASDLNACSSQPDAVKLIQKAYAWAERTPWLLHNSGLPADGSATDPRLRLLVAEVQVRCGSGFFVEDASPYEERAARGLARSLIQSEELRQQKGAHDRFVAAFCDFAPQDDPTAWADRAALAWCGEPGVAAARVVWHDDDSADRAGQTTAPSGESAPVYTIPLGPPTRPVAEVQLRLEPDAEVFDPASFPTLRAWDIWARHVAAHDRNVRRLETGIAVHRDRLEHDDRRRGQDRLESLAEFAAGAGHELNNPLAVIMGRAQLLLGKAMDVDSARGLRAIIGQAQRAHRILRDLMYVARPPEPRARPCQTDEIMRACVRDLQAEAEARGVRLIADIPDNRSWSWADPDPLRHLAEILTRNALEATPAGGQVRVTVGGDSQRLEWSIRDTGRGLDEHAGRHLFDPFFCGRQAGRGLGLGLPRAARFVTLANGDLRWHTTPGHGTTFHVTLPLEKRDDLGRELGLGSRTESPRLAPVADIRREPDGRDDGEADEE